MSSLAITLVQKIHQVNLVREFVRRYKRSGINVSPKIFPNALAIHLRLRDERA